MPRKLYKGIPAKYAVCQFADCPQARNCLHQIACHSLMDSEKFLNLINPKLCTRDAQCRFFRNSAPTLFAFGFKNMKEHMLPQQYVAFKEMLTERFGHTLFYERRRGDIPLTPEEQELIRQALQQVGVTEKLEFDRYEENLNWYS